MNTMRNDDDMPEEIDFSGAERGKFHRAGAELQFPTVAEGILQYIADKPGLTDRQVTDALWGRDASQQSVNQAARQLQSKGKLIRRKRPDGLMGNYLVDSAPASASPKAAATSQPPSNVLSEEEIKRFLDGRLRADGWQTQVAWGKERGIDIDATRATERWIIEIKGPGSYSTMRHNFFLSILGEILQRMDDPNARYSIALPELEQYRNLWGRLPSLAKSRNGISLLLVSGSGQVEELE